MSSWDDPLEETVHCSGEPSGISPVRWNRMSASSAPNQLSTQRRCQSVRNRSWTRRKKSTKSGAPTTSRGSAACSGASPSDVLHPVKDIWRYWAMSLDTCVSTQMVPSGFERILPHSRSVSPQTSKVGNEPCMGSLSKRSLLIALSLRAKQYASRRNSTRTYSTI
jgi:hypothetical protein